MGKLRAFDTRLLLSKEIDLAISNLTADNSTLKLFTTEQPNASCGQNATDITNPVYVRNVNCWAKDIDTTAISVWNNGLVNNIPENAGCTGGTGLAITKRHVLLANHFRFPIGTKMIFVDMNNNSYVRTLTARSVVAGTMGNTDILIGLLDSDLPSSISVIKILHPKAALKLKDVLIANRLPVFTMNSERKAFAAELINDSGVNQSPWYFSISNNPTLGKRRDFSPYSLYNGNWIYGHTFGDSANTCSIVYKNRLIHVHHVYTSNSGVGAYLTINEINQVINNLGNPNNYKIQTEDFSLLDF